MNLPKRGGDWGRLAAYVAFSLVLYYLNVLFFLFAVPLQVLYARRGRAQYVVASVGVLVGIALFALWRSSTFATGGLRVTLVVVEVVGAFLFVAGLLIANSTIPGLRRRLYRLLAATLLAGIVSLPFVLILAESRAFASVFRSQVAQVVKILTTSIGSGPSGGPAIDVNELVSYIRQVVLSNYLFMFFVVLTGMWRIGLVFASGSTGLRPAPLSSFSLPVQFLWPILVLWAGVLAARMLHLEIVHYVAWNLAMIGAFLYGLQGVGIAEHLFDRFHVPRGVRIVLVVVAVILLLIPGVATIVLIAFPILGISELWIHYGRGERDEDNTQ